MLTHKKNDDPKCDWCDYRAVFYFMLKKVRLKVVNIEPNALRENPDFIM
nr:hypothetical protein [Pseudopedobacter sp.]